MKFLEISLLHMTGVPCYNVLLLDLEPIITVVHINKLDSMRLSTLVQRNTENKLAMVDITIQKDAEAQCIGST